MTKALSEAVVRPARTVRGSVQLPGDKSISHRYAMFQLSGLNLYAGFWDIFLAQILQGVALSFLFIPLMALAMARIQPEKMGNATSIFNLMRNIGGSVGIAIMTTFLSRRTQMHQNHLVANVTAGDLQTLRLLRGMQANFYAHGADAVTASRKSLAALYGLVQEHASMLAFEIGRASCRERV